MSGNIPDNNNNQFVPWLNSHYNTGESTSFNLATQLEAGLMSASDFCKLQKMLIPPPFITLTSDNCNTVIKGGIIGIISGDTYIKVDSSVDIKQNENGIDPVVYDNIPLKIHGDTYGIRFSLDIDKLSTYLIRNGRLILKGADGKVGETGDKGPPGLDYILSGPRGRDGIAGTTPPIGLTIESESIDVVNVGSTAITDIQPLINSDGTYDLLVTRQPIGDSEVSTNRIETSGTETNWAVVISSPGASRQVYYLDLDPITSSIYSRATRYAELIKSGYEDAVKFWIKTMSELFDSQKDALCCALDRCRSRIKNDSLRRHFELTSATAKPDYQTTIRTRRDDPEILSSTGILKELYPDSDFCKEPVSECGFGQSAFISNIQNFDCTDNQLLEGSIKYNSLAKDISNELTLVADIGQVIPNKASKSQLLAGLPVRYNCNASYIDVVSSGACVNSDRVNLPNIPGVICEFGKGTCVVSSSGTTPNFILDKWKFTEVNYLPTGGLREYTEDNIPLDPQYGAMWSVLDGGYGLRAEFTDSQNCGGPNGRDQRGTATIDIVSVQKETIIINWDGLGEAEDSSFEMMALQIDGILIGEAHAAGGKKGCSMAPVISNNKFPNGYELDVGNHRIEIGVRTNDDMFHVGAFYQFRLTKPQSETVDCAPGVQYSATIKYNELSANLGPFSLVSDVGSVVPNTVTRAQLLSGVSVQVDCSAKFIEVKSTGVCTESDVLSIQSPNVQQVQKLYANKHVKDYETELILSPNNVGSLNNSISLDLPKGMYRIRIANTDFSIDGKYSALVRVLTTKGMSTRSMDFVNKGNFEDLSKSQDAYNDNTIIVDHDGGQLRLYTIGSGVDISGNIVIGVTPLRLVMNPNQLSLLKHEVKNNILRVKNINVDILMDNVDTTAQTSFEFDGTILVPTKNI